MDSAKLKDFAEELKNIRENQNITLHQIKARTRIDLNYLEAIEEGNFDVMPQVYMRAFIREYAESIGLSSKETLEKYDLARQGKQVTTSEIPPVEEPHLEENSEFKDSATEIPVPMTSNSPKDQPWFIPSVAAAAVIIIGIIIYISFFNNNNELIVKEKPYEEIIEQNKERFEVVEEKNATAPGSVELEKADLLGLKITAVDTSWVRVTIDSDSTTDFILYPNRTKSFEAVKDFDLVIGNSGGVNLSLNSKPLKFKGGYKKVKHILVNKDGIKYLPLDKKKPE